MNESTAVRATKWNSVSAIVGRMLRSIPTIAPTNALTTTSRVNCAAFARNPSATLGNLLLAREQRHAEHAPLRRRLACAVRDELIAGVVFDALDRETRIFNGRLI